MFQRKIDVFLRDDGNGRISAHSSGIGTFVAFESAFVVLGKDHRRNRKTVHKAHETELRSGEEFFHHHLALAEAFVQQHVFQRLFCLGGRFGNNHALTGGQAVVFQDHGEFALPDILPGSVEIGEGAISGRGDVVPGHQRLGEILAGFDTRRSGRRAEDAQTRGAELVRDARR